MNMPGFTAEASLYKTSGHYRTSRQAINSPTQMIGPIHLAVINDPGPGEKVVIVEKWPPDAWDPLEPWTGGQTTGPGTSGPGGGGTGSETGGGTGSADPMQTPKSGQPPKPPTNYNPKKTGTKCRGRNITDYGKGVIVTDEIWNGEYTKAPLSGAWMCSADGHRAICWPKEWGGSDPWERGECWDGHR